MEKEKFKELVETGDIQIGSLFEYHHNHDETSKTELLLKVISFMYVMDDDTSHEGVKLIGQASFNRECLYAIGNEYILSVKCLKPIKFL